MKRESQLILAFLFCSGASYLACASGEMVGNPGGGGNTNATTGKGGSTNSTGRGGSSSTTGGGGTTFTTGGGGSTGAGGTTSTTGAGGTSGGGGVTGFMMSCTPGGAMISNMEDGNFYYNNLGCPNGSWYLATAGGGTAMADPAFVAPKGSVTPVAISPANAMNSASTKGIHISGSGQKNSVPGTYDAYVSLSASLNQPSSTQAGYVNAASYQGVQFWGMISGPVRLQVSTTATDQDAVPVQCTACSDHFGATLTASTAWMLYKIPFSSLAQEGFGVPKATFSSASVMKILWKVIIPGDATTNPAVGAWNIWVDDLSFY